MPDLSALILVCTLKPSPAASSTELIATQVLEALGQLGVSGSQVRIVDHDVKPGVETDLGEGDAWPGIREQLLAADILVLATPVWMGQPSSVAKRVLERLDAELSETKEDGTPSMFGKVAVVAVVGNEDGAHNVSADAFQALNDVGFTIPAQGVTYWVGEAMQQLDYQDKKGGTPKTDETTATVGRNAAHLARLLKDAPYPSE